MKRAKQMKRRFPFRPPIEWMLSTKLVSELNHLAWHVSKLNLTMPLPEETEYDCPIHGKCGGYGECPRC
jgi:hypothetical protein